MNLGLRVEFDEALSKVLTYSQERGFKFEVFRGVTSPLDQAKLWSRSRCEGEIEKVSRAMLQEGARFISELIKEQCEKGRRETDLLPGQSWHQYGEAVDVRLVGLEGRVIWTPSHIGYKVFADACKQEGLTSGFFWRKRDVHHVQMRPYTVRSVKSWGEIDDFVRRSMK